MRTSATLLLSLFLLALASSAARPQPRQPRGKAKPAAANRPPQKLAPWEKSVKGRGETLADAEKNALVNAKKALEEYLQQRRPPLRWSPSPAYIREHLFTGEPERREDEDEALAIGKKEIVVKCWSWKLTVTPEQYRQIVKEDREARSGERMLLAGKVTGALVLLLAALAGYLRLDEWTQGAYTRWLRLALGGIAAGAGAGLLFLA